MLTVLDEAKTPGPSQDVDYALCPGCPGDVPALAAHAQIDRENNALKIPSGAFYVGFSGTRRSKSGSSRPAVSSAPAIVVLRSFNDALHVPRSRFERGEIPKKA